MIFQPIFNDNRDILWVFDYCNFGCVKVNSEKLRKAGNEKIKAQRHKIEKQQNGRQI